MITAKELTDIANQNQCTPEEENIITAVLNCCKQNAEKGEYKFCFKANFYIPNYPSLKNAILHLNSPDIKINYLKLKNQLKNLGFHFVLHEIDSPSYDEFGNCKQKVIIGISWGE